MTGLPHLLARHGAPWWNPGRLPESAPGPVPVEGLLVVAAVTLVAALFAWWWFGRQGAVDKERRRP